MLQLSSLRGRQRLAVQIRNRPLVTKVSPRGHVGLMPVYVGLRRGGRPKVKALRLESRIGPLAGGSVGPDRRPNLNPTAGAARQSPVSRDVRVIVSVP